jgi:hypothetical protein
MKSALSLLIIMIIWLAPQCTGPTKTAGGTTSTENARVSGTIIASNGTPVSSADVHARPMDYLSSGSASAHLDTKTDASGRFSFNASENIGMLIEIADNRGNAVALPCSVHGNFAIDLGTHTAVPMGTIDGAVGGPAVAAHVRIRGLERYVPADTTGRFSVAVPAGRSYSVNIATQDTATDLPPTLQVEPSRAVKVSVDLGSLASDTAAVRAFIKSLGMAAAPLDSFIRVNSEKRVRTLYLRGRNLVSLPASVGKLTFLWEIDLGDNPLDSLPETLADLPLLSHLFLDATPLDHLPEVVCKCIGLTWLKLGNCSLQTLHASVTSLSQLHVLDMSGNSLTAVPQAVCSLASLTDLSFARNRLTRLPASIGGCSNLEILHLDDNNLDSLPDEITRLAHMRVLYAYRNNLAALPDSIGRLKNLERIELQNNRLTGLPASIGSCEAISYLNLWGNSLAGLPAQIVRLQPVSGLTLGGNRLCDLPAATAAWADSLAESSWRSTQTCP